MLCAPCTIAAARPRPGSSWAQPQPRVHMCAHMQLAASMHPCPAWLAAPTASVTWQRCWLASVHYHVQPCFPPAPAPLAPAGSVAVRPHVLFGCTADQSGVSQIAYTELYSSSPSSSGASETANLQVFLDERFHAARHAPIPGCLRPARRPSSVWAPLPFAMLALHGHSSWQACKARRICTLNFKRIAGSRASCLRQRVPGRQAGRMQSAAVCMCQCSKAFCRCCANVCVWLWLCVCVCNPLYTGSRGALCRRLPALNS